MSHIEEINRALIARVAVATRRIQQLETENAALMTEIGELTGTLEELDEGSEAHGNFVAEAE